MSTIAIFIDNLKITNIDMTMIGINKVSIKTIIAMTKSNEVN